MIEEEASLHLLEESRYADNVIDVGKVTFGIDAYKKNKNPEKSSCAQNKFGQREKKDLDKELNERLEDQINNLTRAACALLNSGGGVITAEIENEGYRLEENGIGIKIENSFRKLIQDRKSDLFFDFKQEDSYMLIFVKTWSSENSFPRLCSLTTGLYERSCTSAVESKPKNAMELLWMKKSFVKRSSLEEGRPESKRARFSDDQEMSSQGSMEGEEKAANFFRREQLEFGEILDFTESNTVEFKDFPRDGDSLAFVSRILPRYASAFANADGGYLFFGVENSRKVRGCRGSVDPGQFKADVEAIIENLPRYHFCSSEKKIIFEWKALPVEDEDGGSHGYVFAVRFEPFSGVVFQSVPDSWIVEAGQVKRLTVPRWIELMTAEDPDLSDFANDFARVMSLSDGPPPMVKPVYSVSDLDSLRKTLFPADPERIAFIPEALCDQLFQENPGLKELMESKILPRVKGTLMFSRSWAVDIGLPKNQDILCDALLIAPRSRVLLLTIAKPPAANVKSHSRRTAKQLKHKLVNIGGFSQKICVISRILRLNGDASPVGLQVPTHAACPYPKTYNLQEADLCALQNSVVIVLLGFTSSLSDFLGVHFLNLLTIKQYENISKNLRKTPHQFIYGLPGSGKTVVALEILGKIRNEFNCDPNEILYICENRPLRDFVRRKIGTNQVVTRTAFMKISDFQHIKHIVVDEAQNFRMEDGPWYDKAQTIVQRGAPGVFWIFLDYFQMSHPFDSGLPSLECQYPREWLTTVVRNATNIYMIMKREMERIVEKRELQIPHQVLRELLENSNCGHHTSGICKIQKHMSWQGIALECARMCRHLLDQGYSRKDIAILCSTQETANNFKSFFSQEIRLNPQFRKLRLNLRFVKADEIILDSVLRPGEEIVLDSIRRFSGLERPIVFGINPVFTTQTDVSHNLLLCLVSRANLKLYLLYLKEEENHDSSNGGCTVQSYT